jgi:hypothetical protein
MFRRNQGEPARTERWKREDAAARLREEIPSLATLRLELAESKRGTTTKEAMRIQHVIVDRAAALFLIPCSDTRCREGGHDITRELILALNRGVETVEGNSLCRGEINNDECGRELTYSATASYRQTSS